MIIIETENLTKTYKTGAEVVKAVVDVNINIKQNELVAIMGPSGSGKTTLLTMLGCLLRPTLGRLKIAEKEIQWTERKLFEIRRQTIGFIFQRFNLLMGLTVKENVLLTLELNNIIGKNASQKADEALDCVGLLNRSNFSCRELSGGEMQRVAIARVLATDRPILLADEPTANLDINTGKNIIKLLLEATRNLKKTVIVVTHDSRIVEGADRILKMEDGRIYEN